MKFKMCAKQLLAISLSLGMVFSSPVIAANQEYAVGGDETAKDVHVSGLSAGYEFGNDYYVYGDSAFYSAYKTDESNQDAPKVLVEIFQANVDGSNQKKIHTLTLDGIDGRIELVTEKYIVYNYGFYAAELGLLIDRGTGETTSWKDAYTQFPDWGNTTDGNKYYTKHVDQYYLMQMTHSDVSPTQGIVFNGQNGTCKKFAPKCWDAAFAGKTVYYIREKKDGFYLGSCDYQGNNSKIISKLTAPENCVVIHIRSANKKKVVYETQSSKGKKKYTYKF